MSTTFVGIDPGLDGAVAVISPLGKIDFFDTESFKLGSDTKRQYDATGMASTIKGIQAWSREHGFDVMVGIEKQQAMPKFFKGGQGGASTFKIGYGYGLWVGIVVGLDLPYELIHSTSWKRALMSDMPKEKSASLLVAKRLFPRAANDLKRVKDHGRADALLIAEFARRRSGGKVADALPKPSRRKKVVAAVVKELLF